MKKTKRIGILTAGGDSPGLNAAIRAVGKAAVGTYGWELIGFRDGFLGLIEDRTVILDKHGLAGLLTVGGTILGTSRDKPHRMVVNGETRDMTSAIVKTYRRHKLDALVCIGGGGTHKNAARLVKAGLNIVSLPKTIDNDVAMTDATIGFATALEISTEAIDRLHSTAYSHHRIIVAELMGHRVGWLTLGAGLAGGADVILIPEIPYAVGSIVAAIGERAKRGLNFSIVAVAEGAKNSDEHRAYVDAEACEDAATTPEAKAAAEADLAALDAAHDEHTLQLARQLEALTGLESRVTILGYVTRGGTPSPVDRLLATRLGTAGADLIAQGVYGVMVAARGDGTFPVPLDQVAGKGNRVPVDHSWVQAARHVGTCLGD